jgi:hypothetical protein
VSDAHRGSGGDTLRELVIVVAAAACIVVNNASVLVTLPILDRTLNLVLHTIEPDAVESQGGDELRDVVKRALARHTFIEA